VSAHRGPYAVFTLDELRRIHAAVRLVRPVGLPAPVDDSIVAKCRAALASDPKFRQPSK
jgi:hypothetical protein